MTPSIAMRRGNLTDASASSSVGLAHRAVRRPRPRHRHRPAGARARERDHRRRRRPGRPHDADRGRRRPHRRHGRPAAAGAALRRLPPDQRQRRADGARVDPRLGAADDAGRAHQHALRRRRPRRARSPRRRPARTAGACRSSARRGTASSTTSTASTSARARRAALEAATDGARRGGLGRRRHRHDLPRLQGRHRHVLAHVEDGWTVGVLVQANHGRRRRLRVNGVAGRRADRRRRGAAARSARARAPARSSSSSRPTRRSSRASASASRAGPASGSRAPAGSASTRAATSRSASRRATAASTPTEPELGLRMLNDAASTRSTRP